MGKTGVLLIASLLAAPAIAGEVRAPYSPAPGVLCDSWICADRHGISPALTRHYLGPQRGDKLATMGDFDHRAFTFAGGLFCDVNEQLCRDDRYFAADGQRSGAINQHYTELLFGAGR
ncbi:YcgJ family protein [Shimwellia pseudoproteus]|uniref:YcgJ family protein n=1 Tax=Shimwellia pseudoproteus TaxID=570012 RepID=UPI002FCE5173